MTKTLSTILSYALICALFIASVGSLTAQVFYSNSFETTGGWSLSHTYDDLDDDFCKRDSATATAFPGLQFDIAGADGQFIIGAEDTDAAITGAPTDGIVTLTFDAIPTAGESEVDIVLSLACNADDQGYDDRSLDNGDYLDVQILEGVDWVTVGQFNSAAGGTSISTLYQDVDMDGNGGEVGELPIGTAFKDFVIPITVSAATTEMRLVFKVDGGDEELLIDNIRLRSGHTDDVPPEVFSAEIVDQSTLRLTFSEAMDATNAQQTFHYSGVSDLDAAVLESPNEVRLEYGTPFAIGQQQNLIVFGVADVAGNILPTPFPFTFFYNPTVPQLVITEVMYNDVSLADTLEFIEIRNIGTTEAIIGGCRIEDAISLNIPSGTVVAPGGFYLAARNAEAASAFYSQTFDDYGGQLSDNAERIMLVNAEGIFLDSVSYNDNVPWPTGADGEGPSMELVDETSDNALGQNWVAATNGIGFVDGVAVLATPGFLPTGTLPSVQFDNQDITVVENEGIIEVDFYIGGANGQPMQVAITLVPGTATLGTDHNLGDLPSVVLPAATDGLETLTFPLFDDTEDEGAEIFSIVLSAVNNCTIGSNDTISIIITDDDHVSPLLYINELQASNVSDITDEAGDHDDWIEIYNPNTTAVDLSGYYLSDDSTDPTKSRLPVGDPLTVIPAGGWMLLFADDEADQQADFLHLDFRLSGGGEEVQLTSQDGTTEIDIIAYDALADDLSYGRELDGSPTWVEFISTTPGASNDPNSIGEQEWSLPIYPNPTAGLVYLPEPMDIIVFGLDGREQMRVVQARVLDLTSLPAAMYILSTSDGGRALVIKQ